MKTRYLLVVILFHMFTFFAVARASNAAFVQPVDEKEKQTSSATICDDVVSKLQQDTLYVDKVYIEIDETGKILFGVRIPIKGFFGDSFTREFVSFKRFIELEHRGHKILQVQLNFNLNSPSAHVFYTK